MSRRILLPETNGQKKKDPKRQEAARKAHVTMSSLARSDCASVRSISVARRAGRSLAMTRSFNRWRFLVSRR